MRRSLFGALAVSLLVSACLLPAGAAPEDEGTRSFAFSQYHSSSEIQAELEMIAKEHPSITKLVSLGQTWEGRNITALRLTDNPQNEEGEPDVLIMGAHHANELPSAEVPMYILEFLAGNYESNRSVRTMVDSRDIWFVPLVNPDGHEFAVQQDLNWRKNRRPYGSSYGADLNRNYGHLWGLQGVSDDPASPIYCGPSAFSENETQAIRWLAQDQLFDLSLSYHTYGNQVMYPWGNSIDTSHPREAVLREIANDLADRTGYTPMEGRELYYTTGDSDDWLYANMSALPFTIELGSQRIVPPAELEALCLENLDAALYAIDIAEDPDRALLPDWTFMVYMSADADVGLASEALVDINEMEAAGSTDNVSVIVLYDGRGTGDSAVYRIQKDPGGFNGVIVSAELDDLGEVIDPGTGEADMSDPGTMRNFTAWAQDKYPAQRYLLSIWGHGDGVIGGFVPDKLSRMHVGDLGAALDGFRLDIVGLDMCSMGHFEVAHELRGIADIMIGSEAPEPLAGWDYRTTLERLVLSPSTEPRELAGDIVADYLAANPENYLTQAALDLGAYEDCLLPLLDEFAAVSLDFALADHWKVWPARNVTDTFVSEQDAVDLFQFLETLEGANMSAPVGQRLDALLSVKDELIIASGTASAYPNSGSMAVYFPLLSSDMAPEYYALGFCDGLWDEYLDGMRNPVARPYISPLPEPTANTTAEPYNVTASISGYGGEAVVLEYRVNRSIWNHVAVQVSGDTLWAPVPGQANGSVVEYYWIDNDSNITEPYEIKWGNTTYPSFTVSAYCDLSVSGLTFTAASATGAAEAATEAGIEGGLPDMLAVGNAVLFTVDCANSGPEPVTANITLFLTGGSGDVLVGTAEMCLVAAGHGTATFNWTAESGLWTATATAQQGLVFDTNVSNQEVSAQVNITGTVSVGPSFWDEYGMMFLAVGAIWGVTMAWAAIAVGKAKRRRRASVRRSLDNAKDFLRTAGELGGDTTEAAVLLAKAEAAYAANRLGDCENLVSRSREAAMGAVGGGGGENAEN